MWHRRPSFFRGAGAKKTKTRGEAKNVWATGVFHCLLPDGRGEGSARLPPVSPPPIRSSNPSRLAGLTPPRPSGPALPEAHINSAPEPNGSAPLTGPRFAVSTLLQKA